VELHVTSKLEAVPPGSLMVPPEAPSHVALEPVPLLQPIFLVMVTDVTDPTVWAATSKDEKAKTDTRIIFSIAVVRKFERMIW
jgi:hypothetical protein